MALHSKAPVPGYVATKAEERAYGLLVSAYLEEEVDIFAVLTGKHDDEPYMQIGRAFCALHYRILGNRHTIVLIIHTLTLYNGKPVTEKVADLLEMLERALIASGDIKEEVTQES